MSSENALTPDLASGSPSHPQDRSSPLVSPSDTDCNRMCKFLASSGRIGLLVGSDRSTRSALLSEITLTFGERAFRVANPLVAPLSLTRIMVQVDAPDLGGDDAGSLGAHWAAHGTPGLPAVLAIDDAHTLDDEALAAVTTLAMGSEDGSALLLLMAGQPDIERRIAGLAIDPTLDQGLLLTIALHGPAFIASERSQPEEGAPPVIPQPPAPLRTQAASAAPPTPGHQEALKPPFQPKPIVSDPVAGTPHPGPSNTVGMTTPAARLEGGRPRSARMALLGAAAFIAVGGLVVASRQHTDGSASTPASPVEVTSPVADSAPPATERPVTPTEPPQIAPEPAQPSPLATPAPSLPDSPTPRATPPALRSKSEDQLRGEFQAFLTRTGRVALAHDPLRFELLFRDYLRWRSRSPSQDGPPERR